MWQRETVGLAHCAMDCFGVLGALEDAPDGASTSSSSALAAGYRGDPFQPIQAGEPSTHDLLRAAASAHRDKGGVVAAVQAINPPRDGGLPPSPRARTGCM